MPTTGKLSRNSKSKKSKKKGPPTATYPTKAYSKGEKKELRRLHDYYFEALTTKYQRDNMRGLQAVLDRGQNDEEDQCCLWLVLLKNNDARKLPGLLELEDDDFSVVDDNDTESEEEQEGGGGGDSGDEHLFDSSDEDDDEAEAPASKKKPSSGKNKKSPGAKNMTAHNNKPPPKPRARVVLPVTGATTDEAGHVVFPRSANNQGPEEGDNAEAEIVNDNDDEAKEVEEAKAENDGEEPGDDDEDDGAEEDFSNKDYLPVGSNIKDDFRIRFNYAAFGVVGDKFLVPPEFDKVTGLPTNREVVGIELPEAGTTVVGGGGQKKTIKPYKPASQWGHNAEMFTKEKYLQYVDLHKKIAQIKLQEDRVSVDADEEVEVVALSVAEKKMKDTAAFNKTVWRHIAFPDGSEA